MGLIRRKANTEVVRTKQQPLPPSSAPQVFIGQDGVAYYQHPQTGQMLPAPQQPPEGGVMQGHNPAGSDYPASSIPGAGGEFIGFEGRIGVRYNADGSTTHVTDGHIRSRRTEAAPGTGAGAYDPYIGGRWSKRRLAIGAALTLLVLMVAVDILGMPHYRTSPGVYAGLEGEKTTSNTDLPLIALIRLDRSVFAYTIDGVGWGFGAVGGMLEGDSAPGDDSTN